MTVRDDKMRIPVRLSEPLTDRLLKKRTVYLEFKEYLVRNYLTVQRFHRRLSFDHVAVYFQDQQRCSICAGDHVDTECKSRKEEYSICLQHNNTNKKMTVSIEKNRSIDPIGKLRSVVHASPNTSNGTR